MGTGKTLREILGVSGEPLELITVNVDHRTRTVNVEYLGPNGVEVHRYEADEALRVGAELMQWAAEQEKMGNT